MTLSNPPGLNRSSGMTASSRLVIEHCCGTSSTTTKSIAGLIVLLDALR